LTLTRYCLNRRNILDEKFTVGLIILQLVAINAGKTICQIASIITDTAKIFF